MDTQPPTHSLTYILTLISCWGDWQLSPDQICNLNLTLNLTLAPSFNYVPPPPLIPGEPLLNCSLLRSITEFLTFFKEEFGFCKINTQSLLWLSCLHLSMSIHLNTVYMMMGASCNGRLKSNEAVQVGLCTVCLSVAKGTGQAANVPHNKSSTIIIL